MLAGSFELTDEQLALRDLAARVALERYAPKASVWDSNRSPLPVSERKRLADLGFTGLVFPAEYGGGEGKLIDALIVIEELAKQCQLAAFPVFESNTGPARVIEFYGNDEQKSRILPPIIQGDVTMAISISEPEAGSAATDLQTHARKDGKHFVLNGTKRWCSGAGHAEQYLVYARLNDEPGHRGIGALIVDRDTPGLRFGEDEELMGFRGIPSADMFFDDVRVPAENVLVEPGGFRDLFSAFSTERLGNATMSLAIGQACLDRTSRYVQERYQFGRPIIDFQLVQAGLADMIMQVEAARLLIWRAAIAAGKGPPDPLDASMAKCFANEMAKRVSDLAIQLHGGYGYAREYEIERFHRDAHGWALGGGTPSLQRIRIVSQYLQRPFSQRAV